MRFDHDGWRVDPSHRVPIFSAAAPQEALATFVLCVQGAVPGSASCCSRRFPTREKFCHRGVSTYSM